MSRKVNRAALTLLTSAVLMIACARSTKGQICVIRMTPPPPTSTTPAVSPAPAGPAPAYEVATIKPIAPGGFGLSLRMYIQQAYGIPPATSGWVIGPDWIDKARYAINGRPPDAVRAAMQNMTNQEKDKETQRMMQSLLADRFQLKAHYEAREIPVYELVAVNGSRLKEASPDKHGIRLNQLSSFGGPASIMSLVDFLQCTPDIGGRKIIDKTNLTGIYDISLKWTPTHAAPDTNGAPPADTEGPSLFTAIEEQLGLKLVFTKGPGQVLVIDHIEQPSPD